MEGNLAGKISELFAQGEIVDLNHLIGEDLPAAWPMHMPLQIRVWNYYMGQNKEPRY